MLVKTYGAALNGIDALIVTIEVNVTKGLQFMLVGLPDNAVKESHERIVSAMNYCGYKFPMQQVVINMAPADIKKRELPMTCLWRLAWRLPAAALILMSSQGI